MPTATTAGPPAGLRVLVVDDIRDCAESQAMLLRFHGHDAHVAFDGQEALEKSRLMDFDVVILDLGLPGMDGYELARRLAGLPRPPLLIAVSGYADEESRVRSAEAGIALHLAKPADPARIAAALAGLHRPAREG